MSAWFSLFIAGLLEIFWSVCLKLSDGFTKLVPGILGLIGSVASMIFLMLALKHLPLGTAYAVWTGIGIVGNFIIGILIFHDPVSALQVVFVAMIVIGIVGLRLLGASS